MHTSRIIMILKIAISLSLLLFLCLPYGNGLDFFTNAIYDAHWRLFDVLESIDLQITQLIYFPFTLLWGICLVIKHQRVLYIGLILLCIGAFIFLINAAASITMPMQDFIPDWGIAISVLFFPMILALTYFTKKQYRKQIAAATKTSGTA